MVKCQNPWSLPQRWAAHLFFRQARWQFFILHCPPSIRQVILAQLVQDYFFVQLRELVIARYLLMQETSTFFRRRPFFPFFSRALPCPPPIPPSWSSKTTPSCAC
ncbi:hypothetical protein EMIT0196P_20245 [Pseudomonas chlororaphis]